MSDKNSLPEGLTGDQNAAVTHPPQGRLRIAAGAGSGKTEVLTRRIVSMLSSGIRPEELVAITYTQKAAAEMKSRLIERRGLPPSLLRDMRVATFHAFIGDFLKQDPFGAGIDRSDAVIAENDRRLIMSDLALRFAELHGEEIIGGPEKLGATVAAKLIREFPEALGKIRRYLLKPGEFYNLARDRRRGRPVTDLEINCLEWLFRFYTYYVEELGRRNLLDFDEILLRGRELIKDQHRSGEKNTRRVFLIDEFQDNNPDQLDIVNFFCGNNAGHITVVGDEKQSIYRFQGADIETFRRFKSDCDIILKENFRSYREIIEFADRFLALGGDPGPLSLPQTARRGDSPVKPAVCCLTSSENLQPEDICDHLGDFIQQIVTSGLAITDKRSGQKRPCRYGDIAIIVNSVKSLPREFEDCLAARQIPYLMSGGFSFYARSEIEEILAFLKLLVQPEDDYATAKILTGPLYGLKDSELAELALAGRREKTALLPHLLAQPEAVLPRKVLEFRNLYVFLKNRSSRPGLIELCHCIIEQAGFKEFAATQESELKRRRMENNLNKFLGLVRNFEQRGIFTSLRDFLAFVERILLSGIEEEEAGLGLEEGDALKIMTIHKSKGLEFPIVFCPFLKGRNYKADSKIFFDRDNGLMVADPDLPGRKGFTEPILAFVETDKEAALGEDRRKLYVAFTRAEDLLVICGEAARLEKPEEPLSEIHGLIESNPHLGGSYSLEAWREVLVNWQRDAGCLAPEIAEIAPPVAEASAIFSQLDCLAAFLQQKSLPESADRNEDIFSLADLSLYRSCPRRFFFTRRHISSFAERPENIAGTLGTIFHETVRFFHDQKGHQLSTSNEKQQLAEAILDRLCGLYGPAGLQTAESARHMMHSYIGSELSSQAPWMMEAEVNVKFDSADGAFFLRGFADRVDRDESGVRIIDFKTARYRPEKHVGYADQLALYLIAASRGVLGDSGCLNFGRAFIVYVGEPSLRLVEIEPDLLSFETAAAETVSRIRADQIWAPGSEELCQDCGFAVLCHGRNKQ